MKTNPEGFPRSIKKGSTTVKIYREDKPSGVYFRVGYYLGSQRKWLHCGSLEEAEKEANAKAGALSRGDMDAAQITGRDRLVYSRALEAVRPLGVALDSAAVDYAQAVAVLGGHSLMDAAKFFMRHNGRGIKAITVSDAMDEMIAAKKTKGVSELYLADLRYRLGAFRDSFHCNVNALVAEDVRAWLEASKLSSRSFNNFLRVLGTFFGFAKSNGWLSKDADLLGSVERKREKATPVEIFTPAELAALLAHATADLAPCIALAAFGGLRSEEILRMQWTDIDRRPGFIEIAAHKAKTAQRRLVPVSPALAAWLGRAKRKDGQEGKVWPHSKPWFFESLRDATKAANESAKVERRGKLIWKQNALRHSFISYRVAEVQDVNRVALEAGNSPQIIFKNYRELAVPEQARSWFSIMPEGVEKVVSFGAAA